MGKVHKLSDSVCVMNLWELVPQTLLVACFEHTSQNVVYSLQLISLNLNNC
jgi:hypothetical protein